jgi:hypothetical protein
LDPLALEAALQSLIQALEANTPIVNLQNVANAVGNVQGSNVYQSFRSFSGSLQVPMPSSPAATAPAAPTQISSSPPSNVNEGPLDLLAEQIQTSCEVMNRRMQLERLISSQVTKDNPNRAGRAVVAFPISVNSDRRDAVAEVQIRVNCKSGPAPSILALLPDEETYNVSMLTSDASQFSLAAAVKYFGIGASGGKASQNLYLLQDTDTVALLSSVETPPDDSAHFQQTSEHRRRTADPRSVIFGWQFRPVLGRPTVAPGTRWVYAVLQLPNAVDADQQLTIHVRTCWRSYCKKNRIVGDEIAGTCHGWQPVTYDLSIPSEASVGCILGPSIKDVRWLDIGNGNAKVTVSGTNFWPGTKVVLGSDQFTETSGLTRLGDDRMSFVAPISELVLADLLIVDRYGRSSGPEEFLREQDLTPRATSAPDSRPTSMLDSGSASTCLTAMALAPTLTPTLAADMRSSSAPNSGAIPMYLTAADRPQIEVDMPPSSGKPPTIQRHSASQCLVTAVLNCDARENLLWQRFPVAAIIGTTVIGNGAIAETVESPVLSNTLFTRTLRFLADTQALRANSVIELRHTLLGRIGRRCFSIPLQSKWTDVFSVDQVFWESRYDNPRCLGIAGSGFAEGKFHASVNGTRYDATAVKGSDPTKALDTMLEVSLSKDDASAAKTVTIFNDNGYPVTCDMPKQDAPPADVQVTSPASGISQNDSVYVAVQVNRKGKGLGKDGKPVPLAISSVTFNGAPITCLSQLDDTGSAVPGKYSLLLNSPVTDKARLVQFAVALYDIAVGDNPKTNITLLAPDPALEIKARAQQDGNGTQNPKG